MIGARRVVRGAGYSLPEFMLAALLSAFLVLALLQAYLSAKSVLRWQRASASVDIRGARALQLLTEDLRMAGFYGGAKPAQISLPAGAPDCASGDRWALRPVPLAVFDAANQPALQQLPCLPTHALQPASMLLALRRVSGRATWGRASRHDAATANATQWYLRVAQDGRGDLHWVGEGVPREPEDSDRFDYWAFRARVYYLRSYSVWPGDGVPTLCVERLMSNRLRSECLVEGIEAMQVEFAVDADRDGNPEQVSAQPAVPRHSTHAHIYLLARTLSPPGAQRRAAQRALGGRRVEIPDDGHLRRVYQATVELVNLRLDARLSGA